MKIQQETIYRCDHCNRPMFGKGAMSRHEKYCKGNPNNKHICFVYCKHLVKETETVCDDFENPYSIQTNFICKKKNIYMYSYKFEKNYHKPATALNGLVRMPLECDSHEHMDNYIESI